MSEYMLHPGKNGGLPIYKDGVSLNAIEVLAELQRLQSRVEALNRKNKMLALNAQLARLASGHNDEVEEELQSYAARVEELEHRYDNWLPTAENINSLPEPLRVFIHDLETVSDPAGTIADNTLLRDQARMLEARYLQLQAENERLETHLAQTGQINLELHKDNAELREVGEVVVTTDPNTGNCVAVTRQNAEGKMLSVIWEKPQQSTLGQFSSRGPEGDLLGPNQEAQQAAEKPRPHQKYT